MGNAIPPNSLWALFIRFQTNRNMFAAWTCPYELAWIGMASRIMCEGPLRLPAAARTCEQQVRFSLHSFNLAPPRRRTGLCQFRRRGGAFTERVKRKSYLLLVGTRGEPGGEGGEGGGGWLRVGVRHRHTWLGTSLLHRK